MITLTDSKKLLEVSDFILEYIDFNRFYNKKLLQVRAIGEERYGLELSFEGELDYTMLVQSGTLPNESNDCIRLGTGNYSYTFESSISYDNLKEIIDAWDPINLFPEAPEDEYWSEIREIYLRSNKVDNVFDLARIIHDVFTRCFGTNTFGSREGSTLKVAQKIMAK